MSPRCRCGNALTRRATGRPSLYCSAACRQKAYRKRKQTPAPFRSNTDEWATPQGLFDELNAEFGFDLDPCATAANAKCLRYFTEEDDGLVQPWTGRVFCNPPYGRPLGAWMANAWEASQTTAEVVVLLVPSRTDTRWWREYAMRGEVRYLPGRLRFGDARNSAPFASAVVVFRNTLGVTKVSDLVGSGVER